MCSVQSLLPLSRPRALARFAWSSESARTRPVRSHVSMTYGSVTSRGRLPLICGCTCLLPSLDLVCTARADHAVLRFGYADSCPWHAAPARPRVRPNQGRPDLCLAVADLSHPASVRVIYCIASVRLL